MAQSTERIGKFEIIESLGEGGMGEVFLARDTIIGREVAIKIVRKAALAPPDPQGRFLRESQAAGRLNHPNLVTIHEFGEKAGVLFQVMDYLAGDDLDTALGALPPNEALGLLAQVCDGLAYAHQRGIVHRNLKPSNIRMGRVAGRPAPKLLDCGMTRTLGTDPASAAAHLATLGYTAPEALAAGKGDARADLFSVGVLLYQALTGRRPFDSDTPAGIAQRILQEEPPPLDLEPLNDISPAIQWIVLQALAKDPARRFGSAEAMAEALRAARDPAWTPDAAPVLAVELTKPFKAASQPKPDRPARSHASLAWISALATLAVLGAGGGYWLRARRRPLHPAPAAAPAPLTVPSPMVPAPVASTPIPQPPVPVPPGPAPAPAQAPAPAPAGSAPAATPKAGYASLDEAADALAKDPQGALAVLDRTFAADPGNERAAALRIVALYQLGRYPASSKAIKEARDAGHPLWPMALKNPTLRKMLEQDAKDPHLPRRKAPVPTPPPAE